LFSRDLIKLHNMKFGKTPPVGAELFHAILQTDRRLDIHDEVKSPHRNLRTHLPKYKTHYEINLTPAADCVAFVLHVWEASVSYLGPVRLHSLRAFENFYLQFHKNVKTLPQNRLRSFLSCLLNSLFNFRINHLTTLTEWLNEISISK
jgi:hypothetical protein